MNEMHHTDKNKRKDKIIAVLFTILMLAGLACLLYPPTSDVVNTVNQTSAIRLYRKELADLPEVQYEQEYRKAKRYNDKLRTLSCPLVDAKDELTEYEDMLNAGGNNIMGIINIPKIDIYLPIYHGTENAVLGNGVGHLEGSSLPIGGESTHAVIAAHRGATNARLFTDIDSLDIGDNFSVIVLDKVLTYEIDNIVTVLPEETKDLEIVDGEDYVTLQTCTPYGINSHRLLVRGKHIKTEKANSKTSNKYDYQETVTTIMSVLTNKRNLVPVLAATGMVIVFVGLRIIVNVKRSKKMR